ncbi:unnamed protein product [Miscanthus lutarioriparius]|uniref:Uncharacterized protein n=1 Tax=Miscanthus lutarioriparius TaxID=422564 RepID=A0A811PYL5_9POAL|nr:unnamed protein product [Miscanthus lutarioriparius]
MESVILAYPDLQPRSTLSLPLPWDWPPRVREGEPHPYILLPARIYSEHRLPWPAWGSSDLFETKNRRMGEAQMGLNHATRSDPMRRHRGLANWLRR